MLFACSRVRFILWIVLVLILVCFLLERKSFVLNLAAGVGRSAFSSLCVARCPAIEIELVFAGVEAIYLQCSAFWLLVTGVICRLEGLEGATIPKGPTFQRVFHFKGTTASKELLLKGTTTSKEAFGISPQVGLSERELEVSQTTFGLPQFF